MARFLNEYKEVDVRPRWERVAMTVTLILLFLLIPTTALGYYSESSLPGQPLYPLKRGIESMILLVESVTPYKKSLYYQSLATKRVNETATIVAQAASSGDFSSFDVQTSDATLQDIVVTVQQAVKQTETIHNPQQKQQAQQQLASAIKSYQTQLTQMNYTLEQHLITPTPTQPVAIAEQNQITDTPAPTNTQTDSTSNLQDQITQTQNDLQNLTQDLQTTQSAVVATPTITPQPTATHEGKQQNNFQFFHFWQH